MNKRRFGKPMRLKAVLEYCKLSEKEKKEYKDNNHASTALNYPRQ